MKKTIHFVSGLPRAGSTLLCNLLAQNPRFHATPTCGLFEVLAMVRSRWNRIPEFRAAPDEDAKLRVLRAILKAHHDDPKNKRPVVFDKSPAWPSLLETVELLLKEKAKVLVPVRDVRDVLAECEQMFRVNNGTWEFPQEEAHFLKWQTVEGRCEVWMARDQAVGLAYNRIRDAVHRGFSDRLHFVEYDRLTHEPKKVFQGIYEFLEEKPFAHDFQHIEQVTHEDDSHYGLPPVHVLRPKLKPSEPLWPKVLGKVAKRYTPLNELWQAKAD
jgi:sulfotransferase